MQAALILASILTSGEMTFPNECVITVTSWDSVSSWGGYNLDKPFLDTTKVSKLVSPDRYVFKKDVQPTWGAQFLYRYWVPMDYCKKLTKELLPAQKFSNEDSSLSAVNRKIEITQRDEKNNEIGFSVVGIDGNYLYLKNSNRDKIYCVSRWFSTAIYEIIIDVKKQIELDIIKKSDELIRKFK